ncbi:MAG: TRAP transporter large permease subunit [Deltaproteobacteria bacterium]|nr:TRAP transporter large permease subunit [Deltaproteobacteria bacterium]
MSPLVTGTVVILIATVLLFSGMPIAFALGVTSLAAMLLFMDAYQVSVLAETVFEGVNDFGMLAIPLFIFMGMIAALTRAGSDLYECFHRWLYKLPGGLGIGNIAACAIFAALTGSSPACAAAIGTMGIPEMKKRGYADGLATGIITAGGTLGILIPPSVTMIVYGMATETSIGKLFIAGIVSGPHDDGLLFSTWVPVFILAHAAETAAWPPAIEAVCREGHGIGEDAPHRSRFYRWFSWWSLVCVARCTPAGRTPARPRRVGAFLVLIVATAFLPGFTGSG